MKNLLINFFYTLRFHEIARLLFQKNKTTIIYYHDIEAALFDKHLSYLKRKYNIVSLEDYVKKRIDKSINHRLIITFDDGHINNSELLYILEKHQVPCTIFLVSEVMNTHKHFWFKWHKLDSDAKNKLKKIPNPQRLEVLKSDYAFDENLEHAVPQALNLTQIQAMQPWVSFQSHTHSHPCLNRCTDAESFFEIEHSKRQIEELTKQEVFALAYPNGDFETKDTENAKRAGYQCVLTAQGFFNSKEFDTFELKRLSVNDFSSVKELALRTSGVYKWIKKVV